MMELVSRVNALLRRASAPALAPDDELSCGPIALVTSAHTVEAGGCPVALTLKEFDLLRTLMQNQGHVLSRRQLLEEVWGCLLYTSAGREVRHAVDQDVSHNEQEHRSREQRAQVHERSQQRRHDATRFALARFRNGEMCIRDRGSTS